ncbi:MAG: hypothetical protein ACI9TY_000395 [Alphaproteobacteria bacterium]|jgi:hypothetical protein
MRILFINILCLAIVLLPAVAFADITPVTNQASPEAIAADSLALKSSDVDFFAADLYCTIRDVIRGSLGTVIGLIISITGGYSYLMKKSGYGLFFFFAGVALTALPGIFSWYYQGVIAAVGRDTNGVSNLGNGFVPSDKVTLDAWCAGYVAPDKSAKPAPTKTEKDIDKNAEMGIGLRSLVDGVGEPAYSCFRPINFDIDDDGKVSVSTMLGAGEPQYCAK